MAAAKKDEKMLYCKKCNTTKKSKEFYKTNNLDKYPTGFLDMCKECLTIKVDNYDPETYLWILQECDVPYIPKAWGACLDRYAGDKSKITSTNIIGGYLSKMKMVQYKKWRWKDTQYLQEKADREMEEAMKRQGFEMAEIDQAIEDSHASPIPDGELEIPDLTAPADYFGQQFNTAPDDDLSLQLTEEEKTELKLKWGKTYRPDEWIQLEQLYQEMINSYDIQQAGDINTLKLACKTSLKANQLLDLGDVDGAQKMTKMYDGLMKSGKWTAAQNKTEENELIDSIGEIVSICEADGFIPRYYVDSPQDKVDRVIQDMQMYTRNLVTEELGLGNLIENAVKQMEDEKEAIKEAGIAADHMNKEQSLDDALFDYEAPVLEQKDFEEFSDFELEQENELRKTLQEQED